MVYTYLMTESLITLHPDAIACDYPVITTDELNESWQAYAEREDAPTDMGDLLGVAYMPEEQPAAFISVDLCEVVRMTCASLWAMEKPYGSPIDNIHGYGAGMKLIHEDNDITKYVTALMNNDLVRPVEGIDRIGTLVQNWREKGAYVFANTSTLPGCEAATVRYLGERLLGGFDAILFPRNHENTQGTMNKGVGARLLIEQCMQAFPEPPAHSIPTVHIDDLSHHLASFRREVSTLPYVDAATYQPLYPSEYAPDPASTHVATPLETFQLVDQHLREKSVL
jgi:hypothetical protein